jgi:hypothetical protein
MFQRVSLTALNHRTLLTTVARVIHIKVIDSQHIFVCGKQISPFLSANLSRRVLFEIRKASERTF